MRLDHLTEAEIKRLRDALAMILCKRGAIRALARECGVSENVLSEMKNGSYRPGKSMYDRLAPFLGLPSRHEGETTRLLRDLGYVEVVLIAGEDPADEGRS